MFWSKKPKAPKVSVLVPIYNTSRYLRQCLESLEAQTLRDIEVVCINDGSTDNSLAIVESFAARDPRFRVIDKPNTGYGDSMNRGVEAARGEYVGIVESDDFASPRQYEKLWRFAHARRCDLVKCNYFEHDAYGDREVRTFDRFSYYRVFDPRAYQDVLVNTPSIWAAVYRREFVLGNGIAFNTTPGASFQDTSFVFQCWAAARRAALIPDALPHYRVDNASSSVKSSAKIFEVCGEYALSEAFLARDPERKAAFEKQLELLKFGTYRWNYNRIAYEHRRAFAERWAQEYRASLERGTLDRAYFHQDNWVIVEALLGDMDAFMERYLEHL